jgi:hypothetical protein
LYFGLIINKKKDMHYGDLKNWVIKVINSCENYKQLMGAQRLMLLFESHDSHSHLGIWDRQKIRDEVFTAYQSKQFDISSKRKEKLKQQ